MTQTRRDEDFEGTDIDSGGHPEEGSGESGPLKALMGLLALAQGEGGPELDSEALVSQAPQVLEAMGVNPEDLAMQILGGPHAALKKAQTRMGFPEIPPGTPVIEAKPLYKEGAQPSMPGPGPGEFGGGSQTSPATGSPSQDKAARSPAAMAMMAQMMTGAGGLPAGGAQALQAGPQGGGLQQRKRKRKKAPAEDSGRVRLDDYLNNVGQYLPALMMKTYGLAFEDGDIELCIVLTSDGFQAEVMAFPTEEEGEKEEEEEEEDEGVTLSQAQTPHERFGDLLLHVVSKGIETLNAWSEEEEG